MKSGHSGSARLKLLARSCKRRGGRCDCQGECAALDAAETRLSAIRLEISRLVSDERSTEELRDRLKSPMATLKEGFMFMPGLEPVMVFDGGDALFGYETASGDWIETDEWPFNESFVWADDCERFGIRVE